MPFQGDVPTEVQKQKPHIKQESSGANSPNVITGDNSTVNIYYSSGPRFREKVKEIHFTLGNKGFTLTQPIQATGKVLGRPFNFGGFVPIKLYVEKGVLFADVSILAMSDLTRVPVPIEIKHNEFSAGGLGIDKNVDDSALEIVDEKLNPIFQLIYIDDAHLQLNGAFTAGNTGGIAGADNKGFGMAGIQGAAALFPLALTRIFNYPAREHRGERVRKSNP